jgi:hypothetical protein
MNMIGSTEGAVLNMDLSADSVSLFLNVRMLNSLKMIMKAKK